jgi:hypothetical protein
MDEHIVASKSLLQIARSCGSLNFEPFLVATRNLGPLKEGENVGAEMKKNKGANNTWTVLSTRLSTGETSTQTADLGSAKIDAAYLTMEGMVIYSCEAYPSNDQVTFSKNSLQDNSGADITPKWIAEKRHTECGQDVSIGTDGSVTLEWKSA